MVRPYQESEDGDRDAGKCNRAVTEDALARKTRDDLADHSEPRQDHDVNRRVRVEPEHVLKQHRIPAQSWIKDADVQSTLECDENQCDRQHRRSQHHDDAGRVVRPHKQRQPEPCHAGRTHAMHRDYEVQASKDRREPGDKNANRREHHVGGQVLRAERSVEGPARIDASADDRGQHEDHADDVDVPACQVNFGKREIARPDHDRDQEVAERDRNRGNEEAEDHHHTVHGEELVVGVGLEQVSCRSQQLETHQSGKDSTQKEHQADRHYIHNSDALVVSGQEP